MFRARTLTASMLVGYGFVRASMGTQQGQTMCISGQQPGCFSAGMGDAMLLLNSSKKALYRSASGADSVECNMKRQQHSVDGNNNGILIVRSTGSEMPTAEEQAACRERTRKVMEARAVAAAAALSKPIPETKRPCVQQLNKRDHECFAKTQLDTIMNKPATTMTVSGNIGEVWFADGNKQVLGELIAYEKVDWQRAKRRADCVTFFPSSDLKSETNILGSVITVTGQPSSTPPKVECNVCNGDNVKSLEGKMDKCNTSCDPYDLLMHSSSFHEYADNKPSKKNRQKKNKNNNEQQVYNA